MSEATSPDHGPSSMSSASATPPVSSEAQQVPFQMIPPGMPHFFPNPFMSPYMTQPTDANWQNVAGDGAQQAGPMPGFVISPAQYQEMMQQYFQQMMAASGAQFTIPFPMQFSASFQGRPGSQCSGKSESLSDGRVTATSVSSITEPPNNVSENRSIEPEVVSSITENGSSSATTDEPTTIADHTSQTTTEKTEEAKGDEIEKRGNEEGEEEKERAMSTETTTSESTTGSEEKRKNSLNGTGGGGTDRTDSLIRKQMSEIEKEITRRSQNKNIKKIDDRELAELIGSACQPAAALVSAPVDEFDAFPSTTSHSSSDVKSALPYTAQTANFANKSPAVKESLNQLRSSFNLTDDAQPPSSQTPPMAPTTTTTLPTSAAPMFQQNAFVPQQSQLPIGMSMSMATGQVPFATNPSYAMLQQQQPFVPSPAAPFLNGGASTAFAPQPMTFPAQINPNFFQNGASQHFSPEQLAAVFAQQQLATQPFPNPDLCHQIAPSSHQPTSSATFPAANFASSIAPPPPPSHPISRNAANSAPWPDENKENGATTSTGDEPVWVLRDSFLKRMQRDQRAQDDEMSWHEAATAAQEQAEVGADEEEQETDRLLMGQTTSTGRKDERRPSVNGEKKKNSKETMVHEPAVLIEGVLFRARYLGSTQMLCESRGSKAARMSQAQEAVARVKAPEGEIQPSTEIDLFISTEKIMVLNTDLQRISDTDVRQDILMDHALRTISYIADIGDLVVLMARRMSTSNSDESCNTADGVRKTPKVICHVFESEEASFIAQSIGQAFQVAYVEFLRANGIDDPSYLRQIDYQEVLNSQELLGDELEMFAKKETQKEVVVPKKAGEALGIVVVESGWGSMLPTVVLAHMNPIGPAAHSNKLNIGDQIININGISLVGLPLSAAQTQIKNAKSATVVRLTVVSTPPVVEVRIRRPDTKYQLGFSVQNGVICSLLRGGIAERGGIRVGHRIIEINGTSVVAVAHDRIVNMLATAIGEIHMKTMPTSMFRLLTGQEQPQYI